MYRRQRRQTRPATPTQAMRRLGLEPLESRLVMSAGAILPPPVLPPPTGDPLQLDSLRVAHELIGPSPFAPSQGEPRGEESSTGPRGTHTLALTAKPPGTGEDLMTAPAWAAALGPADRFAVSRDPAGASLRLAMLEPPGWPGRDAPPDARLEPVAHDVVEPLGQLTLLTVVIIAAPPGPPLLESRVSLLFWEDNFGTRDVLPPMGELNMPPGSNRQMTAVEQRQAEPMPELPWWTQTYSGAILCLPEGQWTTSTTTSEQITPVASSQTLSEDLRLLRLPPDSLDLAPTAWFAAAEPDRLTVVEPTWRVASEGQSLSDVLVDIDQVLDGALAGGADSGEDVLDRGSDAAGQDTDVSGLHRKFWDAVGRHTWGDDPWTLAGHPVCLAAVEANGEGDAADERLTDVFSGGEEGGLIAFELGVGPAAAPGCPDSSSHSLSRVAVALEGEVGWHQAFEVLAISNTAESARAEADGIDSQWQADASPFAPPTAVTAEMEEGAGGYWGAVIVPALLFACRCGWRSRRWRQYDDALGGSEQEWSL